MAFLFGDSFDLYATINDMLTRYSSLPWGGPAIVNSSGTAFGVGQAITIGTNNLNAPYLGAIASWISNETTIYGSIRGKWNNVSSGYNQLFFFTLQDANTAQCTICWHGDSSITIHNGSYTGATLATYLAAFNLETWDSWQFKVVIDSSAGSVELRKNGVTSDTYTLSNVNTRAGSNTYANTFQFGWTISDYQNSYYSQYIIDDLYLNSGSGAVPNSWPGDVRALQQVPVSTVQSQFIPSPSNIALNPVAWTTLYQFNTTANQIQMIQLTAAAPGTVISLSADFVNSVAGNAMMAVYDATGINNGPGNLLFTSVTVTNPSGTNVTFPVSGSPTIIKGTLYWIAFLADVATNIYGNSAWTGARLPVSSFSNGFPSSATNFASYQALGFSNVSIYIIPSNSYLVSELVEDGDTTHIYSNTVGAEDIYTLSTITPTYQVVGVNAVVFWKKADAGTRTAVVSVIANGSSDTLEITDGGLPTSYRYDTHYMAADPTGASWTPTTVNAIQMGLKVQS